MYVTLSNDFAALTWCLYSIIQFSLAVPVCVSAYKLCCHRKLISFLQNCNPEHPFYPTTERQNTAFLIVSDGSPNGHCRSRQPLVSSTHPSSFVYPDQKESPSFVK